MTIDLISLLCFSFYFFFFSFQSNSIFLMYANPGYLLFCCCCYCSLKEIQPRFISLIVCINSLIKKINSKKKRLQLRLMTISFMYRNCQFSFFLLLSDIGFLHCAIICVHMYIYVCLKLFNILCHFSCNKKKNSCACYFSKRVILNLKRQSNWCNKILHLNIITI